MKIVIDKSLEDYIRSGNETVSALLSEPDDLVQAVMDSCDFARKVSWPDGIKLPPFAILLSMNAIMLHAAAVRTVLSGHPVAALPQFRTALESACYAYMISKDHALEQIWLNRNIDSKAQKACRDAFQSAPRVTTNGLNSIQDGIGNIVLDAYNTAIDFGAHPNRRGIFDHIAIQDNEDHFMVTLTGLYSPEAFEIQRMLMACLDYGFCIALILTHCLTDPSVRMQEELFILNGTKERLARERFSVPPPP